MEHPLTIYRRQRGLTLAELGAALGVGGPAVFKWEAKRVPAERVLHVERVTGIHRHELRPDIYPCPQAEGAAA